MEADSSSKDDYPRPTIFERCISAPFWGLIFLAIGCFFIYESAVTWANYNDGGLALGLILFAIVCLSVALHSAKLIWRGRYPRD